MFPNDNVRVYAVHQNVWQYEIHQSHYEYDYANNGHYCLRERGKERTTRAPEAHIRLQDFKNMPNDINVLDKGQNVIVVNSLITNGSMIYKYIVFILIIVYYWV